MVKNLVYLAAFTFIIVLSWIGFGIYHNHITSTISKDTAVLISPIPAHFDMKVVDGIANRRIIPADLSSTAPVASGGAGTSPTPTRTVTPTVAPSVTPRVSPIAEPQANPTVSTTPAATPPISGFNPAIPL